MDDVASSFERVSGAIQARLTLHQFLRVVLDECLVLTGAEEGGVLIVNPRTFDLSVDEWRGRDLEIRERSIRHASERSVCARVAASMRPLRIGDVLQHPELFKALSASKIRSELAVPLIFGNMCVSVLNTESERPDAFSDVHEDRLMRFAHAVAPLVQARVSMERDRRWSAAINAFGNINEAIFRERSLQLILDQALNIAEAELGAILLHEPDEDVLKIVAAAGLAPTVNRTIPRGRGLVWTCFDENRQVNSADVARDPRFLRLSAEDVHSLLATPLVRGNAKLGVINLESPKRRAFDSLHEEALVALAGQVVVALENLENHRALTAARAIAALGNMSGHLAHRMNNLLGSIRVIGGFVSGVPNLPEQAANNAREIVSAATEALKVVGDYQTLFASSDGTVSLFHTVRSAASEIELPAETSLEFALPSEEVRLALPVQQIHELFRELVLNSAKALESWKGDRRILVSGEIATGAAIVTVRDSGPGVPAAELDDLWSLRRRRQGDTPGMGFGLWWAKTFLQMHSGSIKVQGPPDGGLVVRVRLPRTPRL